MHPTLALCPETHRPCVLLDDLPAAKSKEKASARPPPSPLRQDHGVLARHNKFGSFQVKIENTTKTKQKNDTKTEQKTMVADNVPTAGQRAVHFRILAIIGVAAACGLSVPASGPRTSLHALYACTPLHMVFGP